MNCFYSSSGHPANKPYADSMPVLRLRRRSGTKSALLMPIRRVYWTAAHIIMVLPSKHEMPTQHQANVSCLPGMNLSAHIHTKQTEIHYFPPLKPNNISSLLNKTWRHFRTLLQKLVTKVHSRKTCSKLSVFVLQKAQVSSRTMPIFFNHLFVGKILCNSLYCNCNNFVSFVHPYCIVQCLVSEL